MTGASIRRVIRIGGSLAITLPRAWAKGKIVAGDEVALIGNEDLRIFPIHSEVSRQDNKIEDTGAKTTG